MAFSRTALHNQATVGAIRVHGRADNGGDDADDEQHEDNEGVTEYRDDRDS